MRSINNSVTKLTIFLLAVLSITHAGSPQKSVYSKGKITYITSELVYVDIGSNNNGALGDTLQVLRLNQDLGLLVITNLSTRHSVCVSLVPTGIYQIGDNVILQKQKPVISLPPQVTVPEMSAQSDDPVQQSPNLLHKGKLGLRLSRSGSSGSHPLRMVSAANYSLQSDTPIPLRFNLYGNRNLSSGSWNIYQAQVRIGKVGDRFYGQAGRVYSSGLAAIGPTDGVNFSVQWNRNYSSGLIAGVQPLPGNFKFSSETKKFGLYGSHKIRKQHYLLSQNLALIGQYYHGGVDREFMVYHLNWSSRQLIYLSFQQSVDFDRKDNIESRELFEWTSSQVSLRLRPVSNISFSSRFSSRRSPVYRSIYSDPIDSLFTVEMRTGWYNSLRWVKDGIGSFNISTNLKSGNSSGNPAWIISTGYISDKSDNGVTYRLSTSYIKNGVLGGIRLQTGVDLLNIFPGNIYCEYELFRYEYAEDNDFLYRHSLACNYYLQLNSRWSSDFSVEIFKDPDYKGMYYFGGFSFHF